MQEILDRLGGLAVVAAGRIVQVAILLVVLWLAYAITMAIVRRVAARAAATPLSGQGDLSPEQRAINDAVHRRRLDTLVLFATRLGRVGVVVFGGLGAISILLPEVITGLGSLGVALGAAVGAALGFGAQQLVRDYLNGILILGENPFSIGDFVSIASVSGTVEEIGLRRTVVRDVDGAVHSVPNGEILVASNFTRTFARVRERFVVAPGTDISRATAVLDAACAALAAAEGWQERFVEAPGVKRIDAPAPGEAGIPILVTAVVRPGEQWEVAGELRRRVIDAMRVAGIDLAAGRTVLVSRGARTDAGPAADAEGGAEFT